MAFIKISVILEDDDGENIRAFHSEHISDKEYLSPTLERLFSGAEETIIAKLKRKRAVRLLMDKKGEEYLNMENLI